VRYIFLPAFILAFAILLFIALSQIGGVEFTEGEAATKQVADALDKFGPPGARLEKAISFRAGGSSYTAAGYIELKDRLYLWECSWGSSRTPDTTIKAVEPTLLESPAEK
jgi:hypothetical protein